MRGLRGRKEGRQGGWSADQGHYALGLCRPFSLIEGSSGEGGCVRGSETLTQTDKHRAKHADRRKQSHSHRQTGKEAKRLTGRETHIDAHWLIGTHTNK